MQSGDAESRTDGQTAANKKVILISARRLTDKALYISLVAEMMGDMT